MDSLSYGIIVKKLLQLDQLIQKAKDDIDKALPKCGEAYPSVHCASIRLEKAIKILDEILKMV